MISLRMLEMAGESGELKCQFPHPEDFEASNFLNEIKSEFTCQRRKEFDYGEVHTYAF